MHFAARKNVLEYDDVMNLQRVAIYGERNAILDGKDLADRIPEIIRDAVDEVVGENCPEKSAERRLGRQGGGPVGGEHDRPATTSLPPRSTTTTTRNGLPTRSCEYLQGVYDEKAEHAGRGGHAQPGEPR